MKKIIVEGHRGYCAKYPENTLISFEKAIELGVDAIEFDVWLSKDKVPVIIHDGDVDRTTDGEGHIRDKTLEEIKQLDAGKWFDEKFLFFIASIQELSGYLKQKYNVTTMGYPDFKMKEHEPDSYKYYDRIGIGKDILTPQLCEKFSEMGFPLHLYCADNENEVIKFIECGADLITANDPIPLIKVLNERGMRI